MQIKVTESDEAQSQPLLENVISEDDNKRTLVQRVINQTFKSTANLTKLLPTGTVLLFQLLAPITTNQGHCDSVNQIMTEGLILLCGLSCFLLSFTDSYRDGNGKVWYGVATLHGFWIIDGLNNASLSPELAFTYRLRFIDFVHAFLSVLVFIAIVLFDQNIIGCFYPMPSIRTAEILTALPLYTGVIGSMLFTVFPTTRHGIGFPLSPH